MEVLCSIGDGEAAIYSLHGVPRIVTGDEGEDGATGELERGRWHGDAQGGAGSVISVLEQKKVVKHSGSLRTSGVTVRVVEEERDGDGARGLEWACLAASWGYGETVGAR